MNWKRLPIILIDIAIAVYLAMAVTAFNKPDERTAICTEVPVIIEQAQADGFLTADEVKNILKHHHAYPQAQPMKEVNTRHIEELLQANDLVEKAECYKTQGGHVRIHITQRIPAVRVMADNGDDYCVDTNGELMPRNPYACNMLVATGRIAKSYARTTLAQLANLILADPFWRNQVVQLNVLPDGSVEMVPRVGEHIIYIGQPVGVRKKLTRLEKFYKYGLSKAGWNKYSRVNVEFSNQIICERVRKNKTRQH